MRNINKNHEPHSLTEHKKQLDADYRNYTDKDGLRQSLVDEQHGICCYCMSRIRPDSGHMKIEHWHCRDNHPEEQLDYNNLLGACPGNQGAKLDDQHCDTKKGNDGLTINPADPVCDVERMIRFLGDGRIEADDEGLNQELNKVLNLNWYRLISNRKAVLDSFKQRLCKGKFDPAKELPKWDGSQAGALQPFSQVVVFWLRKKLQRAL